MRKGIIRTILTVVVLTGAWTASTQYNKEYFFHMGRRFMMNDDYQEAIRTCCCVSTRTLTRAISCAA